MIRILFCGVSILFIISHHKSHVQAETSKVCSCIQERLKNGERVNVVVYFEGGVQPALEKASLLRLNDRNLQNQAIVDALREHADTCQSDVVHLLSARSGAANGFKYFKQYWNSNKMFIRDANADTVYAVAQDAQVLKIKKEIMGIIPEGVESDQGPEPEINVRRDPNAYDGWHLSKIQTAEAWDELGGKRGEGVVVATIDSGVRHTHEQLSDNFVGIQYGWYDALAQDPEPTFDSGHGTHTTAILAGNYTGVAPGAKWMTCKACNETYCPGEALMDCIKFMACPTLPDGSNPDCSKAPHIVSNSWVVDRGVDDFNEDILRWRAMGIIPVWGIGNDGSTCNKTTAPGENPFVIGVGGTNGDDHLNGGSSVGWASDGGIKPDIVAPGNLVVSAWIWSDDSYRHKSGTSQACPVVAGVVALLKVRNPELTFDEAINFLTQNTDPATLAYSSAHYRHYCNSTDEPIDPRIFPNIFFGYGRVNAFKAVRAQSQVINVKQ